MSTPSSRAVTSTRRCRFSRRISVWPGQLVDRRRAIRASRSIPIELTSIVLLIASSDARADGGNRTRSGYGRSLMSTGAARARPRPSPRRSCPSSSAREPGAVGGLGIDGETHRRAARRVLDAVLDVDDRRRAADLHLLERVGHLRRPRRQQFGIRREQLHDHRLRRAGQIADHVLQHLDELDVEAGLDARDLRARRR